MSSLQELLQKLKQNSVKKSQKYTAKSTSKKNSKWQQESVPVEFIPKINAEQFLSLLRDAGKRMIENQNGKMVQVVDHNLEMKDQQIAIDQFIGFSQNGILGRQLDNAKRIALFRIKTSKTVQSVSEVQQKHFNVYVPGMPTRSIKKVKSDREIQIENEWRGSAYKKQSNY